MIKRLSVVLAATVCSRSVYRYVLGIRRNRIWERLHRLQCLQRRRNLDGPRDDQHHASRGAHLGRAHRMATERRNVLDVGTRRSGRRAEDPLPTAIRGQGVRPSALQRRRQVRIGPCEFRRHQLLPHPDPDPAGRPARPRRSHHPLLRDRRHRRRDGGLPRRSGGRSDHRNRPRTVQRGSRYRSSPRSSPTSTATAMATKPRTSVRRAPPITKRVPW